MKVRLADVEMSRRLLLECYSNCLFHHVQSIPFPISILLTCNILYDLPTKLTYFLMPITSSSIWT